MEDAPPPTLDVDLTTSAAAAADATGAWLRAAASNLLRRSEHPLLRACAPVAAASERAARATFAAAFADVARQPPHGRALAGAASVGLAAVGAAVDAARTAIVLEGIDVLHARRTAARETPPPPPVVVPETPAARRRTLTPAAPGSATPAGAPPATASAPAFFSNGDATEFWNALDLLGAAEAAAAVGADASALMWAEAQRSRAVLVGLDAESERRNRLLTRLIATVDEPDARAAGPAVDPALASGRIDFGSAAPWRSAETRLAILDARQRAGRPKDADDDARAHQAVYRTVVERGAAELEPAAAAAAVAAASRRQRRRAARAAADGGGGGLGRDGGAAARARALLDDAHRRDRGGRRRGPALRDASFEAAWRLGDWGMAAAGGVGGGGRRRRGPPRRRRPIARGALLGAARGAPGRRRRRARGRAPIARRRAATRRRACAPVGARRGARPPRAARSSCSPRRRATRSVARSICCPSAGTGLPIGSGADWPTPPPPRAKEAASDSGEWLGSFLRLGGAQLRRCGEAGAAAADREALLTLHCAAAGRAADDHSKYGTARAAAAGATGLASLYVTGAKLARRGAATSTRRALGCCSSSSHPPSSTRASPASTKPASTAAARSAAAARAAATAAAACSRRRGGGRWPRCCGPRAHTTRRRARALGMATALHDELAENAKRGGGGGSEASWLPLRVRVARTLGAWLDVSKAASSNGIQDMLQASVRLAGNVDSTAEAKVARDGRGIHAPRRSSQGGGFGPAQAYRRPSTSAAIMPWRSTMPSARDGPCTQYLRSPPPTSVRDHRGVRREAGRRLQGARPRVLRARAPRADERAAAVGAAARVDGRRASASPNPRLVAAPTPRNNNNNQHSGDVHS